MNAHAEGGVRERLLDVSALEPCEPMEQALAAVEQLQSGEYLRMVHRKEPLLLYPMLEKLGMGWYTRVGDPVEVLIFARADRVAAEAVTEIAHSEGRSISVD